MSRRVFSSAMGALVALTAVAGCYATAPHRAEVTAPYERPACEVAVRDVMTRKGFAPLTPPAKYNMFFGPRTATASLTPKTVTAGIGVVFGEDASATGAPVCSVTLEALSVDPSCPLVEPYNCGDPTTRSTSTPQQRDDAPSQNTFAGCGQTPLVCEMTPAPGMDKTVDDLARHLRDGLGPDARVTVSAK